MEQAAAQVDFALLPYSMITNSGAAIYALSCQRPIIVSPLPLFFELRDQFGRSWVRIADGSETRAAFWAKPTAEDREHLRRRLDAISLTIRKGGVRFSVRSRGQQKNLDQPAFNRHRLNAEKLIVFKS